jgi:hypothetical protein
LVHLEFELPSIRQPSDNCRRLGKMDRYSSCGSKTCLHMHEANQWIWQIFDSKTQWLGQEAPHVRDRPTYHLPVRPPSLSRYSRLEAPCVHQVGMPSSKEMTNANRPVDSQNRSLKQMRSFVTCPTSRCSSAASF